MLVPSNDLDQRPAARQARWIISLDGPGAWHEANGSWRADDTSMPHPGRLGNRADATRRHLLRVAACNRGDRSAPGFSRIEMGKQDTHPVVGNQR